MSQSESITNITKALIQFRSQVKDCALVCTANVTASHTYKYSDLTEIWSKIKEPLKNNGLAVVQYGDARLHGSALVTKVIHESGEWISGNFPLVFDQNSPKAMQAMGSAITYLRRYSLAAMLGLVADMDDDGASANTHSPATQPTQPNAPQAPMPSPSSAPKGDKFHPQGISPAQLKRLWAIAAQSAWAESHVLSYVESKYGHKDIKQIHWKQYNELVEWIQKNLPVGVYTTPKQSISKQLSDNFNEPPMPIEPPANMFTEDDVAF